MNKKNLVIVRAGDYSQHEGWLENCTYDQRNWDLIVSCFGKKPKKWQRDDIVHITYIGGKSEGLYNAFQQIPHLLEKYDYIMMADEDFLMTAQDLNRTFEIMKEYSLQIGQPSLTHDSFALNFPGFSNPQFKIRYTNFCEEITICLHTKVWQQFLPLYEDAPLALFIDGFWNRLTDNPKTQVAIIDAVAITHARPTGGPLWKKYRASGEEGPIQYTTFDHHPDRDKWWLPKIVAHQAILKNGKRIQGRLRLLPHLILGWIKASNKIERLQIEAQRSLSRSIRRSIKNQITGKNPLTKTHIIIHGRCDIEKSR